MPTATNNSGIGWYYSDNDFVLQTFDFNAGSDAAHVTYIIPDTDSRVTVCSCKASPLTPIHLCECTIKVI